MRGLLRDARGPNSDAPDPQLTRPGWYGRERAGANERKGPRWAGAGGHHLLVQPSEIGLGVHVEPPRQKMKAEGEAPRLRILGLEVRLPAPVSESTTAGGRAAARASSRESHVHGLAHERDGGLSDVAVAGPNVSARHDNHRDLRVQPAQRPEHFPTRHAGHQEIGQDDVVEVLLEEREALGAIRCRVSHIAERGDDVEDDVPNPIVVVNQEGALRMIAVRSRSVPCARSLRTTVVMISTTPRRKLTVEPSAVQARQLSATLPSAIAASVFRLASSSRFVWDLLNDTFFGGSLF